MWKKKKGRELPAFNKKPVQSKRMVYLRRGVYFTLVFLFLSLFVFLTYTLTHRPSFLISEVTATGGETIPH